MRRLILFSALATAALVVGVVSPAAADPGGFTASPIGQADSTYDGAKTESGGLAQSDPTLLARTDAQVVPVMVKVDVDPVASYAGGIDGLAATSPSVTGEKLSLSSPAVKEYLAYVDSKIQDTQKLIAAAVPSAKTLATYAVAYGGLAVTVAANQAKTLASIPGVAAVQENALRQLPASDTSSVARSGGATAASATTTVSAASTTLDDDATTFIGADAVWPKLGGRDKAGQGLIIGDIDTGIWPEHPMLADSGATTRPAGGPWRCDFGTAGDTAFACNDKLVGAYAMLDTYRALNTIGAEDFCSATACSARDSDGHGTHTATTIAGDYVQNASIFGVDRGPISGIAPGASVIAYRALGPGGGYNSDLVASVQQAILDGVDVINYSISGSASTYTDPVELAFLDAFAAGISVNASAGNNGPGAATANHAAPWVTTVAASTFDRAFSSTLKLTSSDGATYSKAGATLTAGVTGAPVVLPSQVSGYSGDKYCGAAFPAGSLTGKVVVCERGGTVNGAAIGRVQKGYNASLGAAAGMVLYNPTASDVETDNHFLPAIHLEGPNAELLAFLTAHADVTATWAAGTATKAQGDVMAGFSSRGPIGEFLKPDVTAPGVQVLAGHTPASTDLATGPQGQLYQAIAGTSMSAPHASGVSLLVKAAHLTWTPGQVKSALMTSSLQSVTNPDGSAAGVFDRGAGSIRADRAVAPTLTISETAQNFAASAGNPRTRANLNLPSVYVNPLPGAATVTRTVTNVSGAVQAFKVQATAKDGVTVAVSPSVFTLKAGASQTLTITLNGVKSTAGWHEGQITLTTATGKVLPAVLPVAVNVGDAAITLAQTCTPTEIARGATTTCTVSASNFLPVDVPASITTSSAPTLQLQGVTAPGTKTGKGATWSGTLSGSKPPTVSGIAPVTNDPGGSYLPLSAFGIAPSTFGDDTISNFNVPAFQYGGETYSRIGVVSNGYVVVGGGTAADVLSQSNGIPNPAAPNNVIAPGWTDLNPTAGGAIRVGVLTDGVTRWLIVDWAGVPTFTGNGTDTFEVWIQLGATEGQWIYYGAPRVGDTATGVVTGAENRDGTSGVTVTSPDPTEVYGISTTGPQAGGTVSFGYTLKGVAPGIWSTSASLQSSALDTVPLKETKITVK